MADNEKKSVDEVKAKAPVKDAKKAAKAQKPSIWKKIGKSFREFKAEFKKIVWSSRSQTVNNTLLVLAAILITAVVVGALDYAFSTSLTALGKIY